MERATLTWEVFSRGSLLRRGTGGLRPEAGSRCMSTRGNHRRAADPNLCSLTRSKASAHARRMAWFTSTRLIRTG